MKILLKNKINRRRLKKSYLNKDLVSKGKPNYLVIEVTNFCNLNCKMCPRRFMKREVGHMSLELFQKIIDEATMLDFAYLHFFGEPLFNTNLIKMINYAKKKKKRIGISTNSQLLNQENFNELVCSGIDILFINLYEEQQQAKKINLKKESEIEELLSNRVKNNVKIVIQKVDAFIEKNYKEFKSTWGKFYNVIPCVKKFHSWANQVDEINEIGNLDKKNVIQENICLEPWRGFVICWNGDVVLCCNDYNSKIKIGSVLEKSIDEIWNSEKMQNIRKNFVKKDYNNELCKYCNILVPDLDAKCNPFDPYYWEGYAYGIFDQYKREI